MGRIIRNDIEYGGGGAANYVELTQAQYDALTTPDPDTTYYITDGDATTTCSLVELTQAQYDAITSPDPNTWYFITDGEEIVCDLGDLNDVTISSSPSGKVLMNNGSGWVDDTLFITKGFGKSYTVTANSSVWFYASDVITSIPNGYSIVGILGFNTGAAEVYPVSLRPTGADAYAIGLQNTSSASKTANFSIQVLFAKTGLVIAQ